MGGSNTLQTTYEHPQATKDSSHYTPVLNYQKPNKLSVEKTLTKSTAANTATPTRPNSTRPVSTLLKSGKAENNVTISKRDTSNG